MTLFFIYLSLPYQNKPHKRRIVDTQENGIKRGSKKSEMIISDGEGAIIPKMFPPEYKDLINKSLEVARRTKKISL
jgi:phosphoribosylaminoimidazole (AIR) synthetase